MANYYYLISGLADLVLDEERKGTLSLPSLIRDEFADSLTAEDLSLVRSICYPYDNANAVSLLTERNWAWDARGFLDREELAAELKNPDTIPEYLQEFLAAYREGRTIYGSYSWEDHLSWFFYEEMLASDNPFISEWFEFELNLRNLLAGFNCRKFERPIDQSIIGHNEFSNAIRKSNAPDFSLSTRAPWVEKVINLGDTDVTEKELTLDRIRWNEADEMPVSDPFSVEIILAFSVRLAMVQRWRNLDPAEGENMLNELIQGLEDSFYNTEAARELKQQK